MVVNRVVSPLFDVFHQMVFPLRWSHHKDKKLDYLKSYESSKKSSITDTRYYLTLSVNGLFEYKNKLRMHTYQSNFER